MLIVRDFANGDHYEGQLADGRPHGVGQVRYANGMISQLDYVDGQRAVLDHRRAAVQTNIARYVATIALIRALGGGWGTAPQAPSTHVARAN